MARKSLFLIVPFLCVGVLLAQENRVVWVFFKDKGFENRSLHSETIEDARRSLSIEAIRRRERVLPAHEVVTWRDVSVCYSYVEEIKRLGAHHRVSSDWLNCASFEMLPSTLEKVRSLPFVKEIRDVIVSRQEIPKIEESPSKGDGGKTPQYFDYGPSYQQLKVLDIPEAHARGYTGAGVRIGILDTGFDLRHIAFRIGDSLRVGVVAEHDFLSQERLWFQGQMTGINYYQVEHVDAWQADSDSLWVAFEVVDSGLAQEVYLVNSEDGGVNWSRPLNVSDSEDGRSGYPSVLGHGGSVLVAWQDNDPNRAVGWYEEDVFVWNSEHSTSVNVSSDLASSLWPCLGRTSGYFHLVWASGEKLRRARSSDGLSWDDTATARDMVNPITGLSLATDNDSLFVALTDNAHRLSLVVSGDTGVTWTDTMLAMDSESPQISIFQGSVHILYRDRHEFPLYNMSYVYRDSEGWHGPTRLLADSRSAIGTVSLAASGDSVWVAYENYGYVSRLTWRSGQIPAHLPDTLTPNGFSYSPELTEDGLVFWKTCGDASTSDDGLGDVAGQMRHGTAMLSLIGGYAPGHLYGPAFNAEFILAKTEKEEVVEEGNRFEFQVEEDWWVKGIEWAEKLGVDIVSSSLGYLFVDYDELDGKTAVTTRAADIAARLGVLVVNAVGNRWETVVTTPQDWLVAPADGDSVLAIGGTDEYGEYYDIGAYGPLVDGRDKPDVATFYAARAAHYSRPDSFYSTGGTSVSTALVAGMCALMMEANPSWTNHDVREAVARTASLAGTVDPDTMEFGHAPNDSLGWGVPNVIRAMNYGGNRERVVDGGLESWRASGEPSIWKTTGDSAGVRTISRESDPANVAEGMYSAKLEADANHSGHSVGIYQDIRTSSERSEYRLSCSIKYAARTTGRVMVSVYDMERSTIIETRDVTSAGGWNSLEFTFVTDNRSTRVEILLAEETGGNAYVDGVSVQYLGEIPELPPRFEERIVKIVPNPVVLSAHRGIRFEYVLMNHAIPRLRIYTLSGKLVEEIEIDESTPGRYEIEWIPPSELASGVYIATFLTGFTASSEKFAVIR